MSTTRMNLKGAAKLVIPQAVANQLRVARYRWTLRRFQPYQVRRSRAGYQFELWISDPTAKSWYDRDDPEIPPEMSFLAKHRLRSGATVFDCGAFQCLIAMILAKFVGTTGKVVAVEASPHNYEAVDPQLPLERCRAMSRSSMRPCPTPRTRLNSITAGTDKSMTAPGRSAKSPSPASASMSSHADMGLPTFCSWTSRDSNRKCCGEPTIRYRVIARIASSKCT